MPVDNTNVLDRDAPALAGSTSGHAQPDAFIFNKEQYRDLFTEKRHLAVLRTRVAYTLATLIVGAVALITKSSSSGSGLSVWALVIFILIMYFSLGLFYLTDLRTSASMPAGIVEIEIAPGHGSFRGLPDRASRNLASGSARIDVRPASCQILGSPIRPAKPMSRPRLGRRAKRPDPGVSSPASGSSHLQPASHLSQK